MTFNILGTACYNTNLVCILIKQLNLQIVLKQVKQGVFALMNAVYILCVLLVFSKTP